MIVIPILATIHKFENGTFWYRLAKLDEEQMKIEEAVLYCLASQDRGMRTEQIAEMINRNRLHIRKDGQPVTSNQVYAVVCRFPDVFVKAEGCIMLMI